MTACHWALIKRSLILYIQNISYLLELHVLEVCHKTQNISSLLLFVPIYNQFGWPDNTDDISGSSELSPANQGFAGTDPWRLWWTSLELRGREEIRPSLIKPYSTLILPGADIVFYLAHSFCDLAAGIISLPIDLLSSITPSWPFPFHSVSQCACYHFLSHCDLQRAYVPCRFNLSATINMFSNFMFLLLFH